MRNSTDAALAIRLERVERMIDLQVGMNPDAARKIVGRISTVREVLERRAQQLARVRKRVYGRSPWHRS